MTLSLERPATALRHRPARLNLVAGVLVSLMCWTITVAGLIIVVFLTPGIAWSHATGLVLLTLAPLCATYATRYVVSTIRLRAALPAEVCDRRLHGTLDFRSDGYVRPLRSIGVGCANVAAQTGALLTSLIGKPNVHVFHNIRATGGQRPVLAHAVAAGRTVVIVGSAAWPSGNYSVDPDGRLRCDGQPIGQSVDMVSESVRHWRAILPPSHRVWAMVVVHRTDPGQYTLPSGHANAIAWTDPDNAVRALGQSLPIGRNISPRALAALAAAVVSQ
jgi:hypothetical protein